MLLQAELSRDVHHLAGPLCGRNQFHVPILHACEQWLTSQLQAAGLHVTRQEYVSQGVRVANLHAELPGTAPQPEVVVFGAHYDCVELTTGPCPAANDNASGVACVLALARRLAPRMLAQPTARTLRFSLWVNEEPPFFYTPNMGSRVDAQACAARGDRIVGMLTPETLGFYTDEPNTQHYPLPGLRRRYPTTGNFVAFIGMDSGGALARQCVQTFRSVPNIPSIGAGLPGIVPLVGASDHWSFWREGYPALMVTDTAPFRYRFYHTPEDTPEKLDYPRFARVVDGLMRVVHALCTPSDAIVAARAHNSGPSS